MGVMCLLGVGICVRMQDVSYDMQGPEYVLFYAENQAEDYPTTQGGYKFAELVEERTNGRIKIIVQANATLGYEKEVIEQLQFGGVDFARVSLSQIAEVAPEYHVLQLPYLYRDAAHMWEVLDGEIGEYFMHLVDDSSLVALSWYDAGARNFYNNVRPIQTLEDIQGLRIRVQESGMMMDLIEALGAKAVPSVFSDVYSWLQQGIIDGAENNWPSYESTGHYEVAKYYTVDEHTRVPELQLCAQSTWDKFTEADQEIIMACARESALYERELWIEREQLSAKKVIKYGTLVTTLEPEEKIRLQQLCEPIYEKYCAEYREIIEAIKSIGTMDEIMLD